MTTGSLIFHITTPDQWKKGLEQGQYLSDTFDEEGFIHFSLQSQVLATANRYYRGVSGMILLEAEISKLSAELKYEPSANGEIYPHLYGPLNLDAVEHVYEFPPSASGDFLTLPFQSL